MKVLVYRRCNWNDNVLAQTSGYHNNKNEVTFFLVDQQKFVIPMEAKNCNIFWNDNTYQSQEEKPKKTHLCNTCMNVQWAQWLCAWVLPCFARICPRNSGKHDNSHNKFKEPKIIQKIIRMHCVQCNAILLNKGADWVCGCLCWKYNKGNAPCTEDTDAILVGGKRA